MRAFAYVKGSEAHYRLVHLSLLKQAGYDVAFTSISGSNGPASDPLQLHRYNVEPYPSRTFELVLSGRVRPDRRQGHRRGHPRPAAVQRDAQDLVEVTGVHAATTKRFATLRIGLTRASRSSIDSHERRAARTVGRLIRFR